MIKTGRWRAAEITLILSILACVLEGAFRKWVFRESSGPVKYACYFAKDFIFATILIYRPYANFSRPFRLTLILGLPMIIVGAVLASIYQLNLVGAVLSSRALILMPALAYLIAPRLFGVKIERIAFVLGIVTIANALLGIAQNSSDPGAPINYYATEDVSSIAVFEENVRAAGTFSYITGFANMAQAGSWAGLSLLCLARGRPLYIMSGWTTYLAALVCALVSISRGTVLIVVAMLFVLGISGRRAVVNTIKGIVAGAALAALGYAVAFNPLVVRLTDTVIERHEASDDTIEGRTLGPFLESGIATQIAPFGKGFGTEQVAGVYAETGVMSFANFESQFARLVMETGVIGLLGFLLLCTGALYSIFIARSQLADEGLKRVCVLSIFIVASYFFVNVAFNHIASFFAWIIVSVTLGSVAKSTTPRSVANKAPAMARV